ncbi:hypothetical protein ACFLVC_03860 [Chloroflexota bacterium]
MVNDNIETEKLKLHKNLSQVFNRLCKEKKWVEARLALLEWLENEPDSHWLLAQLSDIYYLERNYEKALEYSEQALSIAPRCPLVLWYYAEILFKLERNKEAYVVYKGLMRRGVRRIAYGECGEGIRDARGIVNDCRYTLGILYARFGDFGLARKYVKAHIANRNRNCLSNFALRDVKEDLVSILEGKVPN